MLFSIFCVRNFLLLVLLFVQKRAAQENTLQAMVFEDSTVAEINVTNLINVARYFFEKQSSVKVFNMKPAAVYPALNNLLVSIVTNFATKIYNNLTAEEALKISDMGSELCIPSAATGYMYLLAEEEDVVPQLDMFRNINTNGRWLFVRSEMNDGVIEDMLKMAFDNQNMINVLVSNYLWREDKFRLYFYDPFSLDNGEVRGAFYYLMLDHNTTQFNIQQYLDKFTKRTSNLRRYEMLVDIFPRPMYAEPVYNRYGHIQKYKFIEGNIIETLSHMMNFEIVYSVMNKEKMPGIVMPNGTLMSGLALIEYERVNYSATTRLLVMLGLKDTAYLYPIEIFNAHYLIPKLYPINAISLAGVGLFDVPTIVMIWVSVFCCIVVRYIINLIESTQDNRPDVLQLASQVIGFQNGISQSIAAIKSTSDRLMIISCLIMYLIVGTSFQGLILAQLLERDGVQLNTLEEILESNMDLYTITDAPDIFKPEEGRKVLSVRNKLYFKQEEDFKRSKYKLISDLCEEWQSGHEVAILMREKSAKFYIGSCYNQKNGKDLLYMVPEKAATFQSSQSVPKSSPFIHEFNNNILRIFEAGLNDLSDMEVDQKDYIERIRRYRNATTDRMQEQQNLVRLENLHEAFVTLLIAWTTAFVVLLLEIGLHRMQKLRIDRHNAFKKLRKILYEN